MIAFQVIMYGKERERINYFTADENLAVLQKAAKKFRAFVAQEKKIFDPKHIVAETEWKDLESEFVEFCDENGIESTNTPFEKSCYICRPITWVYPDGQADVSDL